MINSLIVVGKSPHETTEFFAQGDTVRIVVSGTGYRCYEYLPRAGSGLLAANATWNKASAEAVAAELQDKHRLHFVPRTTEQAEPAGRRISKGHHKVMNHDG
jgi:hypothetical protein